MLLQHTQAVFHFVQVLGSGHFKVNLEVRNVVDEDSNLVSICLISMVVQVTVL